MYNPDFVLELANFYFNNQEGLTDKDREEINEFFSASEYVDPGEDFTTMMYSGDTGRNAFFDKNKDKHDFPTSLQAFKRAEKYEKYEQYQPNYPTLVDPTLVDLLTSKKDKSRFVLKLANFYFNNQKGLSPEEIEEIDDFFKDEVSYYLHGVDFTTMTRSAFFEKNKKRFFSLRIYRNLKNVTMK